MTTQITIIPKVLNVTIRAPFIGITTSGPAGPAGQSITLANPANGLTLSGAGVLGITLASATSYGALSPTDWSTFNAKQPAGNYLLPDALNPYLTSDDAADTYQTLAGMSSYLDNEYAIYVADTYQTISGMSDYQGKITLSGLLLGNGSIVEVAPTGTARLVDVIFDQTLTAADLPTYAATADAVTDVVTFASHAPTNKETYYIVGGTPPTFSDSVNRAYVNEFIGPVVYAVSSSGNTCKLSATSGGAPLDITNAGAGWSLRAAGLASITLSGLIASSHVELEVLHPNGSGWLTTGAGNSMSVGMNGDDTTNYATGTTESKGFTIGFEGNTFYRSFCRIDSYPGFAAGITYSSARYGTDATIANSTPYTTGPSMTSYVSPGFNGATSMRVFDSTGAYNVKLGTRFIVRKIG